MTRINLMDPALLVRQHLVAEYRELPRVFALVRAEEARGRRPEDHVGPPAYVLGPGHLKFFYGRLGFLAARQFRLIREMQRRGYAPAYTDVPTWFFTLNSGWFGHYDPTPEAVLINKMRINQRLAEMGLTEHRLPI